MSLKLTKEIFTKLITCEHSERKFLFAGNPVGSYVSYGRVAANGRRMSVCAGRVYNLSILGMPHYKFEEESSKLQSLKAKFANHLWRACRQSPDAWRAVCKLTESELA